MFLRTRLQLLKCVIQICIAKKTAMKLDNLEYITIENQTTDFPMHYHETFCISLIHSGIEQIDFGNQKLFIEEGTISITNPFEIHSNPLIDKNAHLNFDTIYISNDLMKYLLNGKNITFINRQIHSKNVNRLFLNLKNALDFQSEKQIEFHLLQFVTSLKVYSQVNENEHSKLNFKNFNEINDYIENNISEKFCLKELAKMASINKFGFAKNFKATTGMTPINYILMKKIFSVKKLIVPNSELTDLAYQYNFTDIAHFSKTFKRYIGLSPKKYQESLNLKQ